MALTKSKKNGSKSTIYDYPENLNPFYQDENHKRIRFWKINKSSDKPKKRSNSISLDGIRDLWSFKSFTLKKKSSTLGINKTSESPTLLRRDVDPNYSKQSSDLNLRHTVDNNNFQRGNIYRSSLQNVNENRDTDVEFIRNNRYRSTIQNGYQTTPQRSGRYTYGGSVTPSAEIRYITPTTAMSRGISQSSLQSTNPFDEDDNLENKVPSGNSSDRSKLNTTVANSSSPGSSKSTTARKKKKRAPPPPPIKNLDSTSNTDNNYENELKAPIISTNELSKDEEETISFLTAQIETFVNHADTDYDETKENSSIISSKNKQVRDESPKDENKCEVKKDPSVLVQELTIVEINGLADVVLTENNQEARENDISVDIESHKDRCKISPENNEEYPVGPSFIQSDVTTEIAQDKNIKLTKVDSVDDYIPVTIQDITLTQPTISTVTTHHASVISEPESVIVSESVVEVFTPTIPTRAIAEELRITESNENLISDSTNSLESDRYEIRYVPLKNYSPEKDISNSKDAPEIFMNENSKSIDDVTPPPTPPRRRRSVREIIASIDKCQKMLHINQPNLSSSRYSDSTFYQKQTYTPPPQLQTNGIWKSQPEQLSHSNENIRKFNELTESELKIQRLLSEIQNDRNNQEDYTSLIETNNKYQTHVNDDIFKKCNLPAKRSIDRTNQFKEDGQSVKSNSSSSSSNSMKWNPLEKPSRLGTWNPTPSPRRNRTINKDVNETENLK